MEQELDVEVVPLAEVPLEPDMEPEEELPLVLVVDGDTVLADTRAAVLARSGLAVMKAYDGLAALEIARLRPPDLLLCNVVLRGMTGIDLAMALDDRTACRVLLLSTEQPLSSHAEATAIGHKFASVSMPLHPSELIQHVYDCLDWEPRPRGGARTSDQDRVALLGGMAPMVC